jgi:ABC-2 type transport system ATP-binding protein
MQLTVREFIRKYNEKTGATVLLTSHYMGDVLALCPRVLVIDGGVLQYDGDLPALVKSVRPNKRVTARHNGALSREDAEKLGRVIEYSADRVSLDVEQVSLKETATFLLSTEGVSDMTMEDPPLEEAMRAMFHKRNPSPVD